MVGHHGSPYEAMLLCDTEDDGHLAIPGALAAQLPESVALERQHVSTLARVDRRIFETAAGPIELVIASQVEIAFARE